MNKASLLLLVIVLCGLHGWSQEATHNFGNLKIHSNGALGFHSNLINNGSFDENLGLAGFFNASDITISGALRPIFNDMEVMVEENLFLDVGVGIMRHLNFIDGTISTPRSFSDINTNFINEAFYSGDNQSAKVDGYAMTTAKQKFRFPIGDAERIRPLLLETKNDTVSAKSAYFFENPNSPSIFGESFNTNSLGENVIQVNNIEFWHLECITSARVELIWDDRSEIQNIVETIENLTIVGWHSEQKEWHDLGISARKGDLNFGRMVTDYFDSEVYTILTFGSNTGEIDVFLTNYLITPNNDGINDFLVLDGVEESPNNLLKIFNRWGRAVYTKENYRNDFNGRSNTGLVLRKGKILPVGLYFYVIEYEDIDVIHQGYLYINE